MIYPKLQNAALSLTAAFIVATVFVGATVGPVLSVA